MKKTDQEERSEGKGQEPSPAAQGQAQTASEAKGGSSAQGGGNGKGVEADPASERIGGVAPSDGEKEAGPHELESVSEEDKEEEVESPEACIERLVRENDELRDRSLRLKADFENFKKRVEKEKANLAKYANEAFIGDLLPVIDNMERLLLHSFQEGKWEDFRRGVELVLAEVTKIFSRYGVQHIQAIGGAFDPKQHEAMNRIETDDVPADTVIEECQKGYMYRDRLLRPSLVVVAAPLSKGNGTEDDASEGEEKKD